MTTPALSRVARAVVRAALPLSQALLLGACLTGRSGAPPVATVPAPPRYTPPEIATLIPARIKDRADWAVAVHDALRANQLEPEPVPTCAVLAIVGQESGFQADPVVPGLARVVETRLEQYRARLGPFGRPVFGRLLAARAPTDPRSFEERLQKVRTERDLDLVFRDLLAYYQGAHPATFGAVNLAGRLFDVENLADLNPITTAGPMQVNVRFAEAWARDHHADPVTVRDSLYTRPGGVYYGTARLFGYPATYDTMTFRFADYNAGPYSSRNAALQAQLTRLTGVKLALDGDVLGYGKDGEPNKLDTQTMAAIRIFRDRFQPGLSDRRLREDAVQEKALAFESTDTFRAIKAAYTARFGATTAVPYAVIPQVELESPKLSRKRSTAWFAEAVDRRYQACLTAAAHLPVAPAAAVTLTP